MGKKYYLPSQCFNPSSQASFSYRLHDMEDMYGQDVEPKNVSWNKATHDDLGYKESFDDSYVEWSSAYHSFATARSTVGDPVR